MAMTRVGGATRRWPRWRFWRLENRNKHDDDNTTGRKFKRGKFEQSKTDKKGSHENTIPSTDEDESLCPHSCLLRFLSLIFCSSKHFKLDKEYIPPIEKVEKSKEEIKQISVPPIEKVEKSKEEIEQISVPPIEKVEKSKEEIEQISVPPIEKVEKSKVEIKQISVPPIETVEKSKEEIKQILIGQIEKFKLDIEKRWRTERIEQSKLDIKSLFMSYNIKNDYTDAFFEVIEKAFKHITGSETIQKADINAFLTGMKKKKYQMRVWELAGLLHTIRKEWPALYGSPPKTPEKLVERKSRRLLNNKSDDPRTKWQVTGNEDTHYTLFRDQRIPSIQSVQTTGTCAYHTAQTAMKYWETLENGEKRKNEKISLRKFLTVLSPKEVFERIHLDQGHWPDRLIKNATEGRFETQMLTVDDSFDEMNCFRLLKKSGAAILRVNRTKEIVSLSKESDGFTLDCDVDQTQHSRAHAMLVVGMHKDDDGKWWFWVQNWWSKTQFMEMSTQFLRQAESFLYFPTDKNH